MEKRMRVAVESRTACNSGATPPVLYSNPEADMSDERVLRDGVPTLGRIDIHEIEKNEPLPSERFAEAPPLALTFDDVLLKPAKSDIHPNFVEVGTRLTREIRLNIPILSA